MASQVVDQAKKNLTEASVDIEWLQGRVVGLETKLKKAEDLDDEAEQLRHEIKNNNEARQQLRQDLEVAS